MTKMKKEYKAIIGIYKITSPVNAVYIGSSKDIYRRWYEDYHKIYCKQQYKLYYSFKKYCVLNHVFEILEICDEANLDTKESEWGLIFNVLHEDNLNLSLGTNKKYLSKECKRFHFEHIKGVKQTEETKRKRSLSLSKKIYQYDFNLNLIKTWNSIKEAKESLGITTIKASLSNEQRQAGGFIWMYAADSLKDKIRIINYKKPRKRSSKMKPVLQYSLNGEFIKEWESATIIAEHLGCNKGSIQSACTDRSKTAKGYNWKYKNDDEKNIIS